MNCSICEELIQQRLDGSPFAEAAALESHLVDCPRCAARHAALARLSAGLRMLVPQQPPLDLKGRIVAGVLADHQAQRHRRLVRVAVWAAAASLLLSAAALGAYSLGWLKWNETPQPIVIKPIPPAPPTPTPSVRDSVADAGSALVSVAGRTADETVGQTRLLVPMVTGPSLDELTRPPMLEPTMPYIEAGQGVTVALEPVTSSARRAVDLFRRDLPHMEPPSQP
jgi:hypothetical protein